MFQFGGLGALFGGQAPKSPSWRRDWSHGSCQVRGFRTTCNYHRGLFCT